MAAFRFYFRAYFRDHVLHFFGGKPHIVNTKRNKRWTGDVAKIPAAYLEIVIQKMQDYGDNVQFSTNGTVQGPNYQIINSASKKKAFNGGNLLTQTDEGEFTDQISSTIYSLDHIKTVLIKMNTPITKKTPTRTKRVAGTVKSTKSATGAAPRGGAALAKIKEQIALQKYEYYKLNRSVLPADIREHSEKITVMMESGMSAEDSFNEAIKLCFEYHD